MATAAGKDADAPLKRLGGGRWQTRDERFTIEPQSGTWVVVDATQSDELGLPLVRGPFGSLGDAKAAIAVARDSAAPASPLSERALLRDAEDAVPPVPAPEAADVPARKARKRADKGAPSIAAAGTADERATSATAKKPAEPPRAPGAAEPVEPRWLRDLEPDVRRRARHLLDRLTDAGAKDPEGLVRRDVVGDVAAVAAWSVRRAIDDLGDDADATAVAAMLTDGRDDRLGVRWHLVDGDGRRIHLDRDERG